MREIQSKRICDPQSSWVPRFADFGKLFRELEFSLYTFPL